MYTDKITEERLFLNNSKEDIVRWAKSLHYFNYMRGRAGHNCEGDSFNTHIKYDGIEELRNKLTQLNISLFEAEPGFIEFNPMESYSFDDLDKLKNIVPGTYNIEQPQHVTISGYKAHIWVSPLRFEISVSGTDGGSIYKVSEADFNTCLILENLFDQLNWQEYIDESIKSYTHCISERIYPELFR